MRTNDEIQIDPLYSELAGYLRGISDPKEWAVEKLKGLIASGESEGWIHPPEPGIELYRGIMFVQKNQLKKILGTSDNIAESGSIDFTGEIRPRSGHNVMSFSKDMDVVVDKFLSYDLYTYWVIFTARVDDNPGIFVDMNGIYRVSNSLNSAYSHEKEVLALGPVKLSHIKWGLE